MREKPYFPSPEKSWKTQKDQVTIIFPSTFWLKKGLYFPSPSTSQKPVNIIFPSTSLLKKRPYFPSPKSSKQKLFSNQ